MVNFLSALCALAALRDIFFLPTFADEKMPQLAYNAPVCDDHLRSRSMDILRMTTMAAKEKSAGDSGGTATAEPKQLPGTKPKPPALLPPWKVLLHNDDKNAFEFVIHTIVELTPLQETAAVQCTLEAHKTGVALLLTTHKERAELYRDQFQSKSLTVTIEPAE
jgi:ATP-dependent Clp protease adapter protein ClpS